MDSIFFIISKAVWFFVSPDNLLLVWFIVALFFLWRNKFVWAKRLLFSLAILLIVISFLPIGGWLLYPLETHYEANPQLDKVDGIIVLGGAEDPLHSYLWQQISLGGSVERDITFAKLAKEFPEAQLVFAGGGGNVEGKDYREADVAKQFFQQLGMDVSKIYFERHSRNTWENARLSQQAVKPKAGESWVLVTSAVHMPRAVGVFCQVGWKVIPYPVDFINKPDGHLGIRWNFAGHLKGIVKASKQWLGILAYRSSGRMCTF